MKKVLVENLRFKWYDILFLLGLAAVFFSLPLLFQADSTVYLSNSESEFFGGSSPAYSGIRGPVVPFIIMVFGKLFSYTVYGLTVGLFLTYLIFVAAVLISLHLLEVPKLIGRSATLILASVVLFLNVVILAYSHVILTEFFMITFIAVYAAAMLAFYRYKPQQKNKKIIKEVALSVVSVVALVAAYAIKQMYFPIIVLMYVCYKALDIIGGKIDVKKVLKEILVVFLMIISLFSYINIYSAMTAGNNMEGDSVSAYAGSFLIDGLRYFVPQDEIVYGQPTTVFVNDDAINAIDSFEFTFEPGLLGSLKYVATCFINSPSRWFASYVANYGVVSGVIRCGVDGVSRKYTPVSTTLHFDFLYESGAWIDHFKTLEPQRLSYPEGIGSQLSQQMFGGQVVSTGLATNLLFNTRYANLSIVFHTVAVYFSPIILVASLCLIFASRKYAFINKKLCVLNAMLSFNMFVYILFLAVTAQNIERYGVPMIVFAGLLWVVNLAYLINFAAAKIRKKRDEAKEQAAKSA